MKQKNKLLITKKENPPEKIRKIKTGYLTNMQVVV